MERRNFIAAFAGLPIASCLPASVPANPQPETPDPNSVMLVSMEFASEIRVLDVIGSGTFCGPILVHVPVETFRAVVSGGSKSDALRAALDYYGETPDSISVTKHGESWRIEFKRVSVAEKSS